MNQLKIFTTFEVLMQELVSVILPAYDAQLFIRRSIKSVLMQDYHYFELIVINDASTDSTSKIVQSYASADSRIRLLDLPINVGVAQARNEGIRAAKGSYIAFIDADDVWKPCKLRRQLEIMLETGAYCCCSYYERVRDGKRLKTIKAPSVISYLDMLATNFIGNSSGIYNASVLGKFFQESIGHEDYLMWLSIIKKANAVCVPEVLMEYEVRSDSLSSNMMKGFLWHWGVLNRQEGLSIFVKLFLMAAYTKKAISKRF